MYDDYCEYDGIFDVPNGLRDRSSRKSPITHKSRYHPHRHHADVSRRGTKMHDAPLSEGIPFAQRLFKY